MLRNPALVPLSREHHHTLVLCVLIQQALAAGAPDTVHWWGEIVRQFRSEIEAHFQAEEEVLFPMAAQLPGMSPLVEELRADHQFLRSYAQRAASGRMNGEDLRVFANSLSEHIRKEERQLFERVQELMREEDMREVGADIKAFLEQHGSSATQAHTCKLD